MDSYENQSHCVGFYVCLHALPFENLFPKCCFREGRRGHGTGPLTALKEFRVADEPEEAGLTRLLFLLSEITSWDSRAIAFRASLLWHAAFMWHRAALASSTDLRRNSRVHGQFSCPVSPRLLTQISDSAAVSHLLHPLLDLIPALSAQGEEVLFTKLIFFLCREVTTCSVSRTRCTGTTGTKAVMLFIRHLTAEQSQDRNSFCYLALKSLILATVLTKEKNSGHLRD